MIQHLNANQNTPSFASLPAAVIRPRTFDTTVTRRRHWPRQLRLAESDAGPIPQILDPGRAGV